ncbi:hypothetical protein GOBAR_AA19247 [Gossypium barbadense]|uniref:Uncharacterized protein n=1 Tax=Gossypium barbadense TaxID=3634 RepID=A0A2P5XDL1_GOSBA|nr:hypothetical protein GOBAR_AA19247 [Gossypium barbadense]
MSKNHSKHQCLFLTANNSEHVHEDEIGKVRMTTCSDGIKPPILKISECRVLNLCRTVEEDARVVHWKEARLISIHYQSHDLASLLVEHKNRKSTLEIVGFGSAYQMALAVLGLTCNGMAGTEFRSEDMQQDMKRVLVVLECQKRESQAKNSKVGRMVSVGLCWFDRGSVCDGRVN